MYLRWCVTLLVFKVSVRGLAHRRMYLRTVTLSTVFQIDGSPNFPRYGVPLAPRSAVAPLKRKVGVFKFLRFEERFRKVPFSWRISVDGRSNRAKRKLHFCDGLVWTVGLTIEIKLRFQISQEPYGRCLLIQHWSKWKGYWSNRPSLEWKERWRTQVLSTPLVP